VPGHAVQHETVDAVIRPAIAGAQRLQDHQGLSQRSGVLGGPLQGEAPAEPPEGDHPVEDEVAVRPEWAAVARLDADLGNRRHTFSIGETGLDRVGYQRCMGVC
jgi:hypothetical protein